MLRLVQINKREYVFVADTDPLRPIQVGLWLEKSFPARGDAAEAAIAAGYAWDEEMGVAREH